MKRKQCHNCTSGGNAVWEGVQWAGPDASFIARPIAPATCQIGQVALD